MNVTLNHPKILDYFNSHPNISPEYVLLSTLPLLELVTSSENSESNTVSKLEVLFNSLKSSFVSSHNNLESSFNNILLNLQNYQDNSREKLESKLATIIQQNQNNSKNDTNQQVSMLLKENQVEIINSLHSAFNDNKLHIAHTLESNINNLQSSVHDKISHTSQQLSQNFEKNLQPISNSLDDVQHNVTNFTLISQNSSLKGSFSENRTKLTLANAFPNAVIHDTHKTTASGDFIVEHHECGKILIENKDYNENIPSAEVDKFFRDISTQKCHGIFISQSTGIAHKHNFQVDIFDGFVTVFLHKVNYDHNPIIYATAIIKSLMFIASSTANNTSVFNSKINLSNEDIQKIYDDWKKHNDTKQSIINSLNSQVKLLKDTLTLPALDSFIKTRFVADFQNTGFICPVCSKCCSTKPALVSHMKTHDKEKK